MVAGLLAACGGGDDTPATYPVGGTVAGLLGTGLVLRNNGGDELAVGADGSFTFAAPLAAGEAYAVTVGAQPAAPDQKCSVQQGSGSVGGAVADVAVVCYRRLVNEGSRFVYANTGDDELIAYVADAGTGQLVESGRYRVREPGCGDQGTAADPLGSFVLVVCEASGKLVSLKADPATGALTQVNAEPTGESPFNVAVHPSGRFAYVPDDVGDGVGAFAIDSTTAALTPVGHYATDGTFPWAATVDPSGRFLYVVHSGSGGIAAFAIDPASGALTKRGANVATGSFPRSIAVDPSGRYVYVANAGSFSVSSFRIEADGHLASLGPDVPGGRDASAITVAPNGRHVYVANTFNGPNGNSLWSYTVQADGQLAVLAGPAATLPSPVGLLIDASGRHLYVGAPGQQVRVFDVDTASGGLATSGSAAAGPATYSLAMPRGTRPLMAYVFNDVAQSLSVFKVDGASGALQRAGPDLPLPSSDGFNVDPAGRTAYVAHYPETLAAYAIDPDTGVPGRDPVGQATTGTFPTEIGFDPFGRFGYVMNRVDNVGGIGSLSAFGLAPGSGAPTALGPRVPARAFSRNLSVDPLGRLAYVAAGFPGEILVYRIDAVSGLVGATAAVAFADAYALAPDPGGRFLYASNVSGTVQAFDVDAAAVTLAPIGAPVVGSVAGNGSLAAHPGGRFVYATGSGSQTIQALSVAPTGELTPLGAPLATGSSPWRVQCDPSGRFAYVIDRGDESVWSWRIAGDGSLSPLGVPVPVGRGPFHMVLVRLAP
jgi:6-phosphogluconolactonase